MGTNLVAPNTIVSLGLPTRGKQLESGETQEPVQKLLTIGGRLALVLKTFKKSQGRYPGYLVTPSYYAPQ